LRRLILVAREGFRKDKCGPRAKTFEHHCHRPSLGDISYAEHAALTIVFRVKSFRRKKSQKDPDFVQLLWI